MLKATNLNLFQFLYGTIKIAYEKERTLHNIMFQFLYGTIKISYYQTYSKSK